jgi:hypothetical protein
MAEARGYAVRDAGTPSRLGKIYKTYPYDLRSLLEALEQARLRSFNEGPQVVTIVTGRQNQVIRRYPRHRSHHRRGADPGSGRPAPRRKGLWI